MVMESHVNVDELIFKIEKNRRRTNVLASGIIFIIVNIIMTYHLQYTFGMQKIVPVDEQQKLDSVFENFSSYWKYNRFNFANFMVYNVLKPFSFIFLIFAMLSDYGLIKPKSETKILKAMMNYILSLLYVITFGYFIGTSVYLYNGLLISMSNIFDYSFFSFTYTILIHMIYAITRASHYDL
uniref:ABC transporter permease n=1 Tax=Parastrongyloides trichosuri TaxID=131310 RepID=A0A0N4ZM85_PARTI